MKNKKLIAIIAGVVALFFIGLIGGVDEGTTDVTTTLTSTTEIISQTGVTELESVGASKEGDDEPSDKPSDDKPSSQKATEAASQETTKEEKTTAKETSSVSTSGSYKVNLSKIPAFSGSPYVTVNNNIPGLTLNDRTSTYFESYTPLDSMGRCGVAVACLGKETMPTEDRGEIGSVKPSGWHSVKYDVVDGKYLYNRCHLIGFQLSGENANTRNLITGTRYMNVDGMLPFENMVADYIKETNNHVLYRVTPVFKGDELVARGVQIEAYSVEDEGEGICFNVYCYNNQPDVEIDYSTGSSQLAAGVSVPETTQKPSTTSAQTNDENNSETVWIPKSGKKYHCKSNCSRMKNPTEVTKQEAIDMGYTQCGTCY